MEKRTLIKDLILSPSIHAAFEDFQSDKSLLALPLILKENEIHASPPVSLADSSPSSQTSLNALLPILNPRTPLYLLLRRSSSLVAITFVPYLASPSQRTFFLDHRHMLVKELGAETFSQTVICKEIGEITDARSWEERDQASTPREERNCKDEGCEACAPKNVVGVTDLGYKKNKCRLCDRRMQNPITPDALAALKTLHIPGSLVQLTINPPSLALELTLSEKNIQPDEVSALLPLTHPSYTFHHHPHPHPPSSGIHFIFHSPDSASVKQRMTHTMGIPGLLVHAEDVGVRVDTKVEIHEPSELDSASVGKDGERDGGTQDGGVVSGIGKYRSMYNRQGFRGTELVYEGMAGDKEFLDGLG